MDGVSHVAIGVRDMERSLRFYRDLLGLELRDDQMQPIGGTASLYANPEKGQRRAAHLFYGKGPTKGFLVLTEMPGGMSGQAIKLDHIGISHFAWWVDNLRERVEKLKAAGVKILVGPYETDAAAYGEAAGTKHLTCLFEDPDGIILQFDQRLG
jgi:catechol 2,3-dioxygenase-like lactoylglutathione lyase family enzyme